MLTGHPVSLRLSFVLGASCASLCWFSLLGFGAHKLAPWLARPRAWRLLEALIGLTMFGLAAMLLRELVLG